MNIQKLIVVSAALCMTPLAAFAQVTGGSAGDGDRPMTFTKLSFAEVDKNKDGFISQTEQQSTSLAPELFKRMDTNADKRVSEAEFDAYQLKTKGNAVPK